MSRKKEMYGKSGGNNVLVLQAAIVLTTLIAMLTGLLFYDKWNHENIPAAVIGVILSAVYVVCIKKHLSSRGVVLFGFHIVGLLLCVVGFQIPGAFRPMSAIPIGIAAITDVGTGMSAVILYSMLSLLYDVEPLELAGAYLIAGAIGCVCIGKRREWISFIIGNVLASLGYGISYVMLIWFSYTAYLPEDIQDAVMGAGILFVTTAICYIVVQVLKKENQDVKEEQSGRAEQKQEGTKSPVKKAAGYFDYIQDGFPAISEFKERNLISYKHSKLISEVSGQAAKAIGCDEALVRAGAMYHEIGEGIGEDYVTESLKIAKRFHLPKEVERIIKEHNVEEAVPTSKEAAIVMLSDTIISTMEHSRKKGENVVDPKKVIARVFELRANSGMLDKAGLNDSEIKKLKAVYENLLG